MVHAEDIVSKYVLESLKHQALFRLLYSSSSWDLSVGNRWINRELNDRYYIAYLHIGYRFKGLKVYSDISNLPDSSYKDSGGVLIPIRLYSLVVRYLSYFNKYLA